MDKKSIFRTLVCLTICLNLLAACGPSQPGAMPSAEPSTAIPQANTPSNTPIPKIVTPEATVTPTTENPTATFTAEATQSVEDQINLFMESEAFESELKKYLTAMGLERNDVDITRETMTILGQEHTFLAAAPKQTELTPQQQNYPELYQPLPLFSVHPDIHQSCEVSIVPTSVSELSALTGVSIGTTIGIGGEPIRSKDRERAFNAIYTITNVWSSREKVQGQYKWGYNEVQIRQAFIYGARRIRVVHILANDPPKWLIDQPRSDFIEACRKNIDYNMRGFYKIVQSMVREHKYEGEFVIEFNVLNEPWGNSIYTQKYGSRTNYALDAIQKAIEVRELIMSERKENDPEIRIELGFSHAESHYTRGGGYPQTIEVLQALERNGVFIDYVDTHGHERDFTEIADVSDVKKAVDVFRSFEGPDGSPLKVVIGEYDLNIAKVTG